MVTDLGIVDTFYYKTNKGRTYRITNDFDLETIRRLFEPEPGAGNASAGFFVTPSAPQTKGPAFFTKLFPSKKQ